MREGENGCRIGVHIDDLGYELTCGKGDKCLDFKTGSIVPLADCPEQDVGEGRPGLHNGYRFIRITAGMDEAHKEIKKKYDRVTRKPDREEAKDMPQKRRRDFLGFCDAVNENNATEETTLRWIANLRPPFGVAWVDEDGDNISVYDPITGKWDLEENDDD